MSVTVTVKVTCWPGTAAAALAVVTMVSAGVRTGMVVLQGGPVLPVGQLLPGASEVLMSVRTWSPVSGLFTVTEPARMTVPPTGMSPVHTAPVVPMVMVPEVAVWSPLLTASSIRPLASMFMVMPW